MERLVFFARHRSKSNKELIEEVKTEITKYPFDETTLYNGACIMSIINELDEARNLLARCMLLDKDIYQIKKDPDLFNIRKDVEFMTNLESGKIHPVVKPDQNHGVNRVEIIYRWSGLGKQIKCNRILTWERDHFIESEQKIKIEARVITELFKELTNVIPSDNLMYHITHTDDYPEIYIKFFHKDKGTILLYSSSNAAGMLPYNSFIDGQLGVLNSEKAAKVISFLLNWLSIKRGSPIAISCFGGNEILCEPQTFNSELENLFIKDAGIRNYSINEIREEKLPYALSKLPKLNLKYHTKHKILGNNLYSPLQIDRYYMEGPGSYNIKRHELLFIKMSKNDFSTWFYNSPENFLKTIQEIESELIKLIGRAPLSIIISPLITGFNALGYPEMLDLFASVNIVEAANLNFDSLGNNLVPLVVEVKPTRNDFKHDFKQNFFDFKAYYIPSKYLLIVRRINLGNPKGDYQKLIKHFLKWGGVQRDISSGIENILFSNGRITLYLTKDTDQDKIDKIVSYAASMGRKTKIIGQKNKRIEIAAKEGSLIMTKKKGELPKLINKKGKKGTVLFFKKNRKGDGSVFYNSLVSDIYTYLILPQARSSARN